MAPTVYNIDDWLKENSKFFQPPICNKLMYEDGQLKTFFVGGPNVRKDFHMEEGEELFYMLKGDMKLIVHERGVFKDINIKEGEVFLLPARLPHSPQRKADTIGLVIERMRSPEETDCLRYYVEGTSNILYEKWFHCHSLEALGPIIKEFFASEAYRTGRPIPGSISDVKPLQQDFKRKTQEPFSLNDWMTTHADQIDTDGRKLLFDESYASRIHVLGKGRHAPEEDLPEVFLWQMVGKSIVHVEGKLYELKENQTMLIPKNEKYEIESNHISRILSVVMNPTKSNNAE